MIPGIGSSSWVFLGSSSVLDARCPRNDMCTDIHCFISCTHDPRLTCSKSHYSRHFAMESIYMLKMGLLKGCSIHRNSKDQLLKHNCCCILNRNEISGADLVNYFTVDGVLSTFRTDTQLHWWNKWNWISSITSTILFLEVIAEKSHRFNKTKSSNIKWMSVLVG